MHTGPWESTKKKKKNLLPSWYIPVHDFDQHKEIYETCYFYTLLHTSTTTCHTYPRQNIRKNSTILLLLSKKNSRENWRLEQPVPPSGNPSLGVSLACVSFRWDLRGVPDVSQRDLSAVYLFSPVFLSKEWREADTRVSIAILISHCDRRWNGSPAWMGRACVHASATHAASLSRNATPFCTRYTDTGLSLTGVRCTVDVVSMWNRTDCGHFKTKRRVQLSRLPLSGNQRRLAACRRRAEVKRVFWSWGWTRRRILVTPF